MFRFFILLIHLLHISADYCNQTLLNVTDNEYDFEYTETCVPPNNLQITCSLENDHLINITSTMNLEFNTLNIDCRLIQINAPQITLQNISTSQSRIQYIFYKAIIFVTNNLILNNDANIHLFNYIIAFYFNNTSYDEFININIYSSQFVFISNNTYSFSNSTFQTLQNTCANNLNGIKNIIGDSIGEIKDFIKQNEQIIFNSFNFTLLIQISNYTGFMFSNQDINFANSTILGTQIGILAKEQIFIDKDSIINTTGLGCILNQGNARGPAFINQYSQCYGNGGSNSGYGGIGINFNNSLITDCIFLTNSSRYMFNLYPYSDLITLYQGSGGGSENTFNEIEEMINKSGINLNPLHLGSAGGSILLYTKQLTLLGQLIADGSNAFINQDFNVSIGAGSGGLIKLYTQSLQNSHTAYLSVQGGNSDKMSYTGEGGGGSISYKCTQNILMSKNLNEFCNNKNFSGNFSLNKGYRNFTLLSEQNQINYSSYNLYGENGNFLQFDCPPGYELSNTDLSCQLCSQTTYKLWWSGQCIPCPHVFGKLNQETNTFCMKSTNCTPNECCIEDLDLLEKTGIQLVIFLILITIGYILRRQYKQRDSTTEKNFDFESATREIIAEKIMKERLYELDQFVMGDLLYHAHRILVIGNNTYLNPWYLQPAPPLEMANEINQQEYSNFAQNFNKFAQWNRSYYVILNLLAICYYPIYWWLQTYIKKQKYKKLETYLHQHEIYKIWNISKRDSNNNNLSQPRLKMTKSADYTLLCIDIFIYNNNDLKYIYLRSPIIIYLSGEGNFIRPYYLCESDQFLVSLFFAINQKKEEIVDLARQNILRNLIPQEQREENSKEIRNFLRKFNKISMTLDTGSTTKEFVQNFKRLHKLLEKWNTVFFSEHKVRLQLIIAQYPYDSEQQSANIILIELNDEKKFKACLSQVHENITLQNLQDIKFGIFIYNTDTQIDDMEYLQQTPFIDTDNNEYDIYEEPEQEQNDQDTLEVILLKEKYNNRKIGEKYTSETTNNVSHQFNQNSKEHNQGPKQFSKQYRFLIRCVDLIRFQAFSHKRSILDKYSLIIMICILILIDNFLLQSILSMIIAKQQQINNNDSDESDESYSSTMAMQLIFYPYTFSIILSNLFESIWIPSQSYGILKLYLIFNAMAVFQYALSLIIVSVTEVKFCIKDALTILSLIIKIALNQLSERLIPMSTKLNQLSNDSQL